MQGLFPCIDPPLLIHLMASGHMQMRSVEASLRLDAVASAGLRVSRAKAADLAKRGDLRCAAQHGAWGKGIGFWLLNWPSRAACSAGQGLYHVHCHSLPDRRPALQAQPTRLAGWIRVGASCRGPCAGKQERACSSHEADSNCGCGGGSVNWRAAKGSALVKAGDMISASGMGRLEVTDVTPTKKGRWAVGMVRYI